MELSPGTYFTSMNSTIGTTLFTLLYIALLCMYYIEFGASLAKYLLPLVHQTNFSPEEVSSKCPIKHGRKSNLAMKHFVSMKKLVLVGVQPNLQSQLIQVRKQKNIFRILMTKFPCVDSLKNKFIPINIDHDEF